MLTLNVTINVMSSSTVQLKLEPIPYMCFSMLVSLDRISRLLL